MYVPGSTPTSTCVDAGEVPDARLSFQMYSSSSSLPVVFCRPSLERMSAYAVPCAVACSAATVAVALAATIVAVALPPASVTVVDVVGGGLRVSVFFCYG